MASNPCRPESSSDNTTQSWLFLLPPAGGARQVSNYLYEAFTTLQPQKPNLFDSAKYLTFFASLCGKKPSEELVIDLVNQSIIVSALQYDTTHLFVPALCPVTLFALNLLRKQGIKTIHWFIEDYARAPYWRDVLDGYSLFLGVQRGELEESCRVRATPFVYLPTAATLSYYTAGYLKRTTTKRYDIAFIGVPSTYRIRLLEILQRQGFSLAIAGEGWGQYQGILQQSIVQGGWIEASRGAAICAESTIGLNLCYNDPATIGRAQQQISPRVFDFLLAGCALVSDESAYLDELLADCTFTTFSTIEQLVAAVQSYTTNRATDLFQTMIEKNSRLVRDHHLWIHRARTILESCRC